MRMRPIWEGSACEYTYCRTTAIPHYFRLQALSDSENGETLLAESELFSSAKQPHELAQLETLDRGLAAFKTNEGVFLTWRLFRHEVHGFNKTGLTGADFYVYRNGKQISFVSGSTNFIDADGSLSDKYSVAAVYEGKTEPPCDEVKVWPGNYIPIPLRQPEGGTTPKGEAFVYHANDLSVADVNGDGRLEYILKWDPSNSKDVSQKGYTGHCIIDCYTLEGALLWRLDMGANIRAGAHYTQFMVYDFNGDGKAEMAVKTAPGTRMTVYNADGSVKSCEYITIPESDIAAGYSNDDNYVCSAEDYREHLIDLFVNWQEHPEVKAHRWPQTLEECFGIDKKYVYPLRRKNAQRLADYYIDEYAPSRSPKNRLREFEGFVYSGPEYLSMFAGDGSEIQTVAFPFPRIDDGLMWGDYSWNRIEPCNRVDRFLSGVAYLDGKRPHLIVCRGYYTRTCICALEFFENKFNEVWRADSGWVPMRNPFAPTPVGTPGLDPKYGFIASQGNHSLSAADVDGDGRDEIIYGACVLDDDGSVLYSGQGFRADGAYMNWGHGDAMQTAVIDPDLPGQQIMHVFEEGSVSPYGEALVEAESGRVIYGESADTDLGRCMTGQLDPNTRGLQVWVRNVRDCRGNVLNIPMPGTNTAIRWASDLTTQVTDGVDYVHGRHTGIINDPVHGILLSPENTSTNNSTKGNPCLIADVIGDFRENLILRSSDDSELRIYVNTSLTNHKLYTMLHDVQYRCGVAWQNNCYNQPVYPSFYYGSDMDFEDVFNRL
ncbi:MAG: rhamnogalacturonan lyase [Clostridia bacterium]|nr:rhamnogalacturonan lyase [Clostridia bacterium]